MSREPARCSLRISSVDALGIEWPTDRLRPSGAANHNCSNLTTSDRFEALGWLGLPPDLDPFGTPAPA